jgi:hypothetical protein
VPELHRDMPGSSPGGAIQNEYRIYFKGCQFSLTDAEQMSSPSDIVSLLPRRDRLRGLCSMKWRAYRLIAFSSFFVCFLFYRINWLQDSEPFPFHLISPSCQYYCNRSLCIAFSRKAGDDTVTYLLIKGIFFGLGLRFQFCHGCHWLMQRPWKMKTHRISAV